MHLAIESLIASETELCPACKHVLSGTVLPPNMPFLQAFFSNAHILVLDASEGHSSETFREHAHMQGNQSIISACIPVSHFLKHSDSFIPPAFIPVKIPGEHLSLSASRPCGTSSHHTTDGLKPDFH